jgi:phosphate transport system protein
MKEFEQARHKLYQMWQLTIKSVEYAQKALLNNDQNAIIEIFTNEKLIDGLDIEIDNICEVLIARFAPVAVDLRLMLAALQISNDLERISDQMENIAKFVKKIQQRSAGGHFLTDVLHIDVMFETILAMLEQAMKALDIEDATYAKVAIENDNVIDDLKETNIPIIEKAIAENAQNADYLYELIRIEDIVRKLERTGDHCVNIGEEVVFFIEGRIIKHGNAAV